MKTKYPFAQTFVRLSRALGVLAALAGLCLAGNRAFQAWSQVSLAKYRPSVELDQRLSQLEQEATRTRELLKKRLPGVGQWPGDETFPKLQRGATTPAEFSALMQQLEAYSRGTVTLKSNTVAQFNALIEELRVKLLQHAAAVAGPKTENLPSAPTTAPVVAPARPNVEPVREEENVFADLNNSQRESRLGSLKQVRTFLEDLESKAEKPESKTLLKDALLQLAQLMRLVPSPFEIPSPRADFTPPVTSSEPAIREREDVAAERVAQSLRGLLLETRNQVLEDWRIDGVWNSARVVADNEQAKSEAAKTRVRSEAVKGVWGSLTAIGQGLLAGFLVLVIADFLQTQLDIARSTTKLAAVAPPDPN